MYYHRVLCFDYYFLPSSLKLNLISCSTSTQLTVINTAGYEDTVLWNPYGNEGMGYNNFVCVESVKVSLQK